MARKAPSESLACKLCYSENPRETFEECRVVTTFQSTCIRTCYLKKSRGDTKGWFRKRVVLVNVPSFRFFVPGEHANVPSFRFSFSHPDAKGVRQKEVGKKVTKKVTEASRKVTESVPKTKKSDRTPFAALLLRHPDSGGTSECTLVPVFVPGGHPPNPPYYHGGQLDYTHLSDLWDYIGQSYAHTCQVF